jgi:uncharacterized membrane protein
LIASNVSTDSSDNARRANADFTMNTSTAWASLALSLLCIVFYEAHAHRVSKHDPTHQARFINSHMRMAWAQAMAVQPGFEIVAVQALRNTLMSATVVASTAALALIASLTLGGASLASGLAQPPGEGTRLVHVLLGATAVGLLFASFVCSAMSMRYFGNATLVVSMPVASPERKRLNPLAVHYVQRAGHLYSWSLRLFLMVVPAVAGIVHPLSLLPATVALLVALRFFDQPTPVEMA